jgi:3-deoxy-D-manno-octulosonate 8-phosphate phosphatase (KDO 8-P phosphatase)
MSAPSRLPVRLLRRVRLVVFDFDGVFTDNRVLVMEDGREAVLCTRADGLGVQLLQRAGVECVVLSTETNPVVGARCRKLGLPCVQGQWNKAEAFEGLLRERGMEASEVAYVGNDVNDLACLERAGVAIVVADAHPAAKAMARLVTTRKGGDGAVREICEWLLEARGVDLAAPFRRASDRVAGGGQAARAARKSGRRRPASRAGREVGAPRHGPSTRRRESR